MEAKKLTITTDSLNVNDNMPDLQPILNKMVSNLQKSIDSNIEEIIRTHAKPVLKGEITKGKVKWRGIRLEVHNNIPDNTTYKVIQRGTQIGKDIVITYHYK